MSITVINLRKNPVDKDRAIAYIQSKWADTNSLKMYEDCISRSIVAENPLPIWYVLKMEVGIIGYAGLIMSDFISCGDLWPWLCALHIVKDHQGNSLGKLLIEQAKADAAKIGFPKLYLCTDHVGYYEKYGFSYFATGYHPCSESSRVYECLLNNGAAP